MEGLPCSTRRQPAHPRFGCSGRTRLSQVPARRLIRSGHSSNSEWQLTTNGGRSTGMSGHPEPDAPMMAGRDDDRRQWVDSGLSALWRPTGNQTLSLRPGWAGNGPSAQQCAKGGTGPQPTQTQAEVVVGTTLHIVAAWPPSPTKRPDNPSPTRPVVRGSTLYGSTQNDVDTRRDDPMLERPKSMREDAQPGIGTPTGCRQAIDVHQQLPRSIIEVRTQGPCPRDIDIEQSAGDQPDFLVDATIP